MKTMLHNLTIIVLILTAVSAIYGDDTNAILSGHIYSTPPMLPAIMPLPGADVYLSGNGVKLHAISDSEGLYEFSGVLPGMYILSAAAPGHLPAHFIDSVSVEAGIRITDLDIYLTPYDGQGFVTLSGFVWEKDTDTPVHPAYITLYPLADVYTFAPIPEESICITVVNKPDGSYLIENIPRGVYNIVCTSRGFHPQTLHNVELGSEYVSIDFYLERLDPSITNLLSGVVSNETTNNPIPNARVTMVNLDGPEMLYQTHTDNRGYFQFSSIYPGNYEIEVHARGYLPFKDTITIDENTWITDFNIFLKPIVNDILVTLYGSVWGIGYDENPVYPAQIILIGYTSTGNSVVYSTQNNPDGSYKIGGIIPSVYLAICVAPGYQTKIIRHLPLYQPEHHLDFYLSPIIQKWGYISGKVFFDKLGTPVKGAELKFFSENAVYHHTISDLNGNYLARLPIGEYYVSCSYRSPDGNYHYHEYYDDVHSLTEATLVPVKTNNVTPHIDFGIPYPFQGHTVTITGRVTDNENMPLGEALVKVWQINVPSYSVVDRQFYFTWTDDDGYYKIEIELNQISVSSGPIPMYGFIVSAEKRGYKIEFYDEKPAPYLADILWAYTSTLFSNIDFTLDPVNAPNSISGILKDEAGQGIAGGFVIAVDACSGEIIFTYSNNMGQYTLEALKPHYYYLLFMAQGFVPEYFDDVHVWEDATPVLAHGTVNGIDATLTSMYQNVLPGIVAGKIVDDQGQGLSGALVAIKNDQGVVLGYDLTDDNGGYEISGIGDGNYQVVATKVTFTTRSSWIDFDYGISEIMIVDFELEQTVLSLPDLNQEANVPDKIMLMPSYPNPFNPVTNIQFSNPSTQEVRLIIYDILGKKVKELVHNTLPAGWYTFKWDARDESGQQVASGIYFYALETSDQRFVNKLIFRK